jgi:hypothetical protein
MKFTLKLILAAGVGFGAVGLAASPVAAMPARGLDPALAPSGDSAKSVETVRWICRRCHWVPGWRRYWWGPGYGYYGPEPWWRYRYYYPWWPYAGWSPYLYGYYW